MNSDEIKLNLLKYFRWKRQFICCTEFGTYNGTADVVAYDLKDTFIEVEVKVSKSDFLADFKNKQKKHNDLLNKELLNKNKHDWKIFPNKFYFAVPKEMEQFALENLKDYPKYGLIIIHNNLPCFVKKAYSLYSPNFNKEKLTAKFLNRLNTETITLREKSAKYKKRIKELENAKM